jgi:membrane protease YdiL (CAAX protease family)
MIAAAQAQFKKRIVSFQSLYQNLLAKAAPAKKKVVAQKKKALTRSKQVRKQVSKFTSPLKPLTKNLWVGVLIAILLAAPLLALVWRPIVGAYVTAAVFLLLMSLALWAERFRTLAISAAILPLALMVNLSLPHTSVFVQTTVFYITILLLTLIYGYLFALDVPVKVSALGKKYVILLPFMVVVGEILGLVGYSFLYHHYALHSTSLALVAAVSVVFAIAEEMFFRGLLQQQASKLLHPGVAAALSVVAYTFMGVSHGTILTALFALIAGIVLSTTYYFKQNLVLTTTINACMKLTYVGLIATFIMH